MIYVEEDIQMPVLTPNTLLFGQPLLVPEEDLDEDVPEMKRRQGETSSRPLFVFLKNSFI